MATTILFLHVLFAVAWFGGAIYTESILGEAARSDDPAVLVTTASQVTKTNERLLVLAAFGTLIFGAWRVLLTSTRFEDLWVAGGIVLALGAIAYVIAYQKPRGDALRRALGDQEASVAAARQVQMANHALTAILFLALILMVYRPG